METSEYPQKYCNQGNDCVRGFVLQPLSNFGKMRHTVDGHQNTCKACLVARQRRLNNKKKEGKDGYFNLTDLQREDLMFAKIF